MLVARDLDVTVDERVVPDLQATVVRVHGRRESIESGRPATGTSRIAVLTKLRRWSSAMSATSGGRLDGFGNHRSSLEVPDDLDLEKIMVMLVHRRASCPERSVLADDVLADLELCREAEIFHVTVRLGRVQAEQGLVPLAPLVRPLREVFDRDRVSVRPRGASRRSSRW